jgi:hypothetical protein
LASAGALAPARALPRPGIGPVGRPQRKTRPPLGGPLLFGGLIGRLLLLGEVRVAKFLLRYIYVHRNLGRVIVVAFLQVVGYYLVKALAKLPEKEGAAVGFLAREAEVRGGRAHVEATLVAMGFAQALVQQLVERKLGGRKK